ncbi:MAG TPA: prepilin peptidase [Anaerolineales bacterium]|nr:prepilin peptidase [Anaerolineales bacterium]
MLYNVGDMDAIIILPFILGWMAGTLINYLSDVLPATRRLSSPVCNHCSAQRTWYDTLLLKRCTNCRQGRGKRTWVVLIGSIVATLAIWVFPPKDLGFWLGYVLLTYFAVVFVIDVEHRLILHPVSYFGAGLALLIGIKFHGIMGSLLGGALGFGIMFALYYLGILFARWMSKRRGKSGSIEEGDALGFGDVNLAGILGLIFGVELVWICILFAILAGGAVSLILVLGMLAFKRYDAFTAIPYAPFLILSAVYILYF